MKHYKSLLALVSVTAVAVTATMGAESFRKLRPGDSPGSLQRMERTGKSPFRQKMPSAVSKSESTEGEVRLRGLVINSDMPYIGEFAVGSGIQVGNVYEDYEFDPSGSAVYADGKFYISTLYEPSIGATATAQYIYDAETWDLLDVREDLLPSSSAVCMTYDPLDCTVYGYFHNDDGGESRWFMYGTMNLATGEVIGLNSVDETDAFMCIAASPDGFLYGIDVNGQYCRIEKKTGDITVLGHTDVKPYYMQSAVIDWSTGKFYWAAMTDTGESSLYEIDPTTYIAKKISDFPQNQEFTGLYVAEDISDPGLAAAPENVSAVFDKDNLEGRVSFTAPGSCADGSALTGEIKAHVAVDGNHYEKAVSPGEECTFDVAVNSGGLYIFSAWVSDDKGNGHKATVQKWIGPDYPTEPGNVKLEKQDNKLSLTWEAPSTVGLHGGYVNPDEVTYVIGNIGLPLRVVYDYKGLSYEYEVPADLTADVKFYVRPVNGELVGPIVYSNEVTVGSPVLQTPVSLNAASIEKFIVIDANGDGETWTKQFGGYSSCEGPADDWMLTPEIRLNGGELYELKYEVSAKMGVLSPRTIQVFMGTGDTVSDMTFKIDEKTVTTIRLTSPDTETVTFTAPADGDYRIGFHDASATSGTLALHRIYLKSQASASGPEAPGSVTVTPAPLGELSATIGFVAPVKTIDGNNLEYISKIEVFNGDRLVGEVSDPAPGSEYSIVDDKATQGLNKYEIVATDNEGTTGLKATAQGWVGQDIPVLPENLSLVESEGNLVLSWEQPAEGIHDGYVVPEYIVYTVVEPTYGIAMGTAQGTEQISIPLGEITSQGIATLGLQVSNDAGTNPEMAISPSIIYGPAYTLPFHEHFSNGRTDYSWHISGESLSDDGGWMPVLDKGPDGEPGVTTFWGMFEEEEQELVSGKISLKDAEEPMLRFYQLFNIGEEYDGGSFSVGISESLEGEFETIYQNEISSNSDGWVAVEIPLAEHAGKEVVLSFKGSPIYGSLLIGLDDISIREKTDFDAAIEAIAIDKDEVEVGVSSAKVTARIQNHGVKDLAADSYKVGFYAGERRFALLDGRTMGASWGQEIFEAEYAPSVEDSDPSTIVVKIESEIDEYPANDVSASVNVYVVKPMRPEVTDLAGASVAEGIALTWTKPDQSGLPIREITDDFESYRDFDINRAGDWKIIDQDQIPGARVSYFFPGSTGPMGWVVMNPSEIPTFAEGSLDKRLPPYSGARYMVAFGPRGGDNDDWLITPELSGRAQEISFMARAESSREGREMFEVYYSTGSPAVADMVRLDDVDYRTALSGWEEHRFMVPEGAKYFAVRCVSHSRLAMHIDDFRYESAPTPLKVNFIGYNIYRDGHRLNDEILTSPSYLDSSVSDNESHIYTVRAVYDRGESDDSNEVSVSFNGIDSVTDDYEYGQYYDLHGRKVTENGNGNEIVVKRGQKVIRK